MPAAERFASANIGVLTTHIVSFGSITRGFKIDARDCSFLTKSELLLVRTVMTQARNRPFWLWVFV